MHIIKHLSSQKKHHLELKRNKLTLFSRSCKIQRKDARLIFRYLSKKLQQKIGTIENMILNKYLIRGLFVKNKFALESITLESPSTVIYNYTVSGPWRKVFSSSTLRIDFGTNITNIPSSILTIPLLTNILPISWICNATIKIPSIDKTFFDCIEEIKHGYKSMYPKFLFLGKLEVKAIVSNHSIQNTNSCAMFFFSWRRFFLNFSQSPKRKPSTSHSTRL